MQKPLTTLMTLDGSIHSPARTCAGKRVGTAGIPYQTAYLQTILENAGVDPATVEETHVGFNLVPAMLSRKVDATLGAFWNYEGADLRRRGRKPDDPADGEARRADLQRADLRRPPQGPRREVLLQAAALPARDRARATSACASTRRSASTRC